MEKPNPSSSETSSRIDEMLTPASTSDLDDVRRIMQGASDFKFSQGDDLWGTAPFTDEEVGRMIDSGNLYVLRSGGVIAASVILLQEDERMWGEEQGKDDTALYVHKLVTGNEFRGQGLGEKVIGLAEDIAKDKGKSKMRLDCPYDNESLHSYYVGLGFHEVRRYDRPSSPGRRNPDKDVFRAALLEREISVSSDLTP